MPAFKLNKRNLMEVLERGHKARGYIVHQFIHSSPGGGEPAHFLKRNGPTCRDRHSWGKKADVPREAKTVRNVVLDARITAWSQWKATYSLVRPSPRSGD